MQRLAVLGVTLLLLHGKVESAKGRAIIQASQVAATIWPIAFAAATGSMLHSVALYRAQQGTQLRVLDMLLTSRTVGGMLKYLVFSFRFSLGLLLLVLIWCFSPLGSQAILRAAELQSNTETVGRPVVYFPVANISSVTEYSTVVGVSSYLSSLQSIRAIILSSLYDSGTRVMHSNGSAPAFSDAVAALGGPQAAVEAVQQDLWGNVRVPFIHMLDGYDPLRPSDWIQVPPDRIPPYQSLIGVPIRGMPQDTVGNTTVYINSTYHFLRCSGRWHNTTAWLLDNGHRMPNFTSVWATEFNWSIKSYPLEGSKKGYYGSLEFFSRRNVTSCNVHSSVVEVEVRCVKPGAQLRRSCRSTRIRNALGQGPFSNATVFSRGDAPGNPLGGYPSILLHDMVNVDLATHNSEFNAFQMYLSDSTAGFANTAAYGDEFCSVSREAFEARLGMLINTFWVASLEQFTILNRDGIKSPKDVNWTTIFYDTRKFLYANSTSVSSYFTEPTYRILVPWISVYLAAVTVLALATICNLWLRLAVRVPDFIDSVSALARDTPFVRRPAGVSSALGGAEQMDLLKDRWVRVQDVQASQELGRIALSDDKTLGMHTLERDRLYE
ncbi:hypothetical protein B0H67DRAFT_476149 [Lasiosphaeris hirsuta]|uniref:Uncharacterized protein n=1 Tax=Lasiosphaeris hirsuta TaxID=260670 RepID=A0AA40BAX2_9PEZI|nr:hypothetical protein B0H67DRAFT_476149 [Lasiosphaeris hirsuta]